ncbi:hypothetical protein [Paenibacillus tarimensis]|uniref:hypothetical protein n=1 Tax=Paenibacillus tarimensis TaxID=416012 RepID=UPI001F30E53C|nr:hypothetical protein [Paenibacillus tarimensis]MCF2945956.1 hypothetical protein [Paenibacillus tarimensis]
METKIRKNIYDHRKIIPQVYALKPGDVRIQQIPKMQYVSQQMNTAFHMNWAGHPEPIDEQWIVVKVVNQLKQITKNRLGYQFKLMPHEIIWHGLNDCNQYSVTYMMQVPDCITLCMYEEARAKVERNLRGQAIPETKLIEVDSILCAQKLHVGHYCDTVLTYQEIEHYTGGEGYQIIGDRKEIYLTPAMQCHLPETWKTVVSVEIENPN